MTIPNTKESYYRAWQAAHADLSGEVRELVEAASSSHDYLEAYFKACQSSQPADWLEAALLAKQWHCRIEAALAKPAQSVDVEAIREVIESHINEAKKLRHDPESQDYLYEQADKLEAAIKRVTPRVTERLVQAEHLYRGDCPDALQPESRDTECEACREEDALRAHLLSQDAEIERLSQESAQQFIRARDWAELSGKNEARASLAESRLAAANALLRDIKDWDVNQAQGTCLMVPLNLRKRIQAHLSENADVQP